ncbi:UDP-N-acetylglucosamine transferase subunit ALG14 isoform X2 [Microcaecilia unicolor]|uniref:UDP-N-acetylglucosamine transferase subunit ALG14 n=1 Tax=Microcaecilia unicolor TaxID=1415580 RepID=A0A6P7YJA9_9AMPH|nr:UDP-N-acetylglucosamine transferase subunit ALG14 homolog isoform X2 [Microcaecilia unicolor]
MLKFGIQLLLAAVILLVLIFVFLTRLLLVLRAGSTHKPGKTGPLTVFTVAGSGGHTTEILRLLGSLSQSYSPTHYIMADSDKMSEDKICSFERSRGKQSSKFQVLCNGPGTCVPVCASAVLLGILGIKKVIIIYVESICRVENLSLSGRILYHFSDYFIVQWPVLKEKYPKSVYLGRIV